MASILDALTPEIQAVSTLAAQAAAPDVTTPPAEDRLAALEQFVVTWGLVLEKLAPLLEKL